MPPYPTRQPTQRPTGPANLRCFDLNPPSYGFVRDKCVNVIVGESCVFSCRPGYSLIGNSILTCSTGGWSSPAPVCLPIICPNATTSQQNTNFEGNCFPGLGGTSCTIICHPGYRISTYVPPVATPGQSVATPVPLQPTTATIECTENRVWATPFPSCVPMTCPNLPATIVNGNIDPNTPCTPGIAFQSCKYVCDSGFSTIGSSSLLCHPDGTWSDKPPTCTHILCRSIFADEHTDTQGQCDPGYSGQSCTVTCRTGYFPVDTRVLNCTIKGEWDGPIDRCKRFECPSLPPPPHSSFVPNNPVSITTVSIICLLQLQQHIRHIKYYHSCTCGPSFSKFICDTFSCNCLLEKNITMYSWIVWRTMHHQM